MTPKSYISCNSLHKPPKFHGYINIQHTFQIFYYFWKFLELLIVNIKILSYILFCNISINKILKFYAILMWQLLKDSSFHLQTEFEKYLLVWKVFFTKKFD